MEKFKKSNKSKIVNSFLILVALTLSLFIPAFAWDKTLLETRDNTTVSKFVKPIENKLNQYEVRVDVPAKVLQDELLRKSKPTFFNFGVGVPNYSGAASQAELKEIYNGLNRLVSKANELKPVGNMYSLVVNNTTTDTYVSPKPAQDETRYRTETRESCKAEKLDPPKKEYNYDKSGSGLCSQTGGGGPTVPADDGGFDWTWKCSPYEKDPEGNDICACYLVRYKSKQVCTEYSYEVPYEVKKGSERAERQATVLYNIDGSRTNATTSYSQKTIASGESTLSPTMLKQSLLSPNKTGKINVKAQNIEGSDSTAHLQNFMTFLVIPTGGEIDTSSINENTVVIDYSGKYNHVSIENAGGRYFSSFDEITDSTLARIMANGDDFHLKTDIGKSAQLLPNSITTTVGIAKENTSTHQIEWDITPQGLLTPTRDGFHTLIYQVQLFPDSGDTDLGGNTSVNELIKDHTPIIVGFQKITVVNKGVAGKTGNEASLTITLTLPNGKTERHTIPAGQKFNKENLTELGDYVVEVVDVGGYGPHRYNITAMVGDKTNSLASPYKVILPVKPGIATPELTLEFTKIPLKDYSGAVKIVKTPSVNEAMVGDEVYYSFEITNTSDLVIYDVVLNDPMLIKAGLLPENVVVAKQLNPKESVTYTTEKPYTVTELPLDEELINIASVSFRDEDFTKYEEENTGDDSKIKIIPQKDTNEPIIKDVDVEHGGELPPAEEVVENLDELPEGTTVEWVDKPDTNISGTHEGAVVITYPDGSSEEKDVVVNVNETEEPVDENSMASEYEPIIKDVDVEKGEKLPAAEEVVENLDELPDGTTVDWTKKPDTDKTGVQEGEIKVSYPDGSSEKKKVVVSVVDPNSTAMKDLYKPIMKELNLVKGGKVPAAETTVENLNKLPEGTTAKWKEIPDTSKVGKTIGAVIIEYPDGSCSVEAITINVIDGKTMADMYDPRTKDLTLKKGEELPKADTVIINKDELPAGTKYEWTGATFELPDGTELKEINVVYPDGSDERVFVKVNYTTEQTDNSQNDSKDDILDKLDGYPDNKGNETNSSNNLSNKDETNKITPPPTNEELARMPATGEEKANIAPILCASVLAFVLIINRKRLGQN